MIFVTILDGDFLDYSWYPPELPMIRGRKFGGSAVTGRGAIFSLLPVGDFVRSDIVCFVVKGGAPAALFAGGSEFGQLQTIARCYASAL